MFGEGEATELAQRELLAGRYAVERELGRGAYGRVLLAADTAQGGAPRAIKLVAPEHEARLRWEFGLLGKLSHPNLARVYELLRIERASAELEITRRAALRSSPRWRKDGRRVSWAANRRATPRRCCRCR